MTAEDFKTFYPQFNTTPESVLSEYLSQAEAICTEDRWQDMRNEGIRLYVAHKLTLYLRTKTAEGATDAQVASAGAAKGIVTNKSVAGVSVGMSESSATTAITGWGAFKTTEYGIQFLTLARIVGIGGMYVQ